MDRPILTVEDIRKKLDWCINEVEETKKCVNNVRVELMNMVNQEKTPSIEKMRELAKELEKATGKL